jgi:hypothetical protein
LIRNPSACPSTIRPSTTANVSGTAREKSGRTIGDFFLKKTKSDLTKSSSQRLGGTRKAKGVSSRPFHPLSEREALAK